MEDEDLIRKKMEDTRTSLTEKVEALEQRMVDTVQETTTAVQETVETVKDSIQETVATVTESVAETAATVKDSLHEGVAAVQNVFDFPAHVRRYPWAMLAGSVATGFCLERYFSRETPQQGTHAPIGETVAKGRSAHGHNGGTRDRGHAAKKEAELAPELAKLKGLAMGALLGTVREMVVGALPPHMGDQAKEIIDGITQKLGGQPLPSSDWDHLSRSDGRESQPAPVGEVPGTIAPSRRW